jgi:hypothetical protein
LERNVAGVVNLQLPTLKDASSKWKVAIMPIAGVFSGHEWSLTTKEAQQMARAALFDTRR